MKKLLALTIALLMLTMSFVACGNNNDNADDTTTTAGNNDAVTTPADTTAADTTTAAPELAYGNALELLEIIFEKYNAAATEETKLYVCGGNVNNFETTNPEGPAAFVALENEDYNANLGFPAANADKIASAASMFNMMNANTFNCYTIQFTDGTDVDAMITALKDNILARQWICGSPEKLVIAKAPGNCIIVVWGVVEFGGIVDPVAQSFATSVEGASIVVEHSFAQ